jgi:hypothetical protein
VEVTVLPRSVRLARARAAVAAGVLALAAPSLATHPLSTDDAGTLGEGRGQLELGAGLSRDRSSAGGIAVRQDARELAASLGLGLAQDVDLTLEALATSLLVSGGGEVVGAAGPGDVALELKWRALGGEALALAAKAGVTLPTGDPGRGLGAGRPGLGLALAATRAAGRLSLDANVGYERRGWSRAEDRAALRRDRLTASLAVRAAVRPSLQLVAEIGGATAEERAARTPGAFALAGAVIAVAERVDLDVGVRVGLSESEPDVAWLGGATWRF